MVLNVKTAAVIGNGSKVHSFKSHVDADAAQLVFFRVKAAHSRKRRQKRQRILAAGNADGYFVAVLYHFIVFACAANVAEYSFCIAHFANSSSSRSFGDSK